MTSVLRALARLLGAGPDRRRHPRRSLPILTLQIDGRAYQASDWSLGGFRLPEVPPDLEVGAVVELRNERRAAAAGGRVLAEVIWIDADGIGLRIAALDSVDYDELL